MDVDRAGSGPSLQQVLTRDNVAVLLDDPAVCERLYPLLPEGAPRTRTELESVVRSPQFHQAVEALNAGLQSGQASSLATQLGLDASFVGGPFAGTFFPGSDRSGGTNFQCTLCVFARRSQVWRRSSRPSATM